MPFSASLAAALAHGDVATVLVVIAVMCLVGAVYLVFTGRALEALVAAMIGLLVLLVS